MGWEDPDPAEVVSLGSPSAWSKLAKRYEPNRCPRPLERCLEVVKGNGARTAVIETRYIDPDYRSEFSAFFSRTFASIPDSTHRIHFFSTVIDAGSLSSLTTTAINSYLGFVTIRPSPLGRVGRTMLVPPASIQAYMSCSVLDSVHFFGQKLVVRGVPFAQQDTQFGRCAHVAAWICHYTAVLRGDVARQPMAEFSIRADATVSEGRPIPSQGLTGLQLSNLLQEFGLPPIVYRMGGLPTSGAEPAVPNHDPHSDPGTWDTRAIAVLCRFLNSSYPVLVGTHDHAFVIIGYERVTTVAPNWIRFYRHDDQRGPYLAVNDVLHDVDPDTGDAHTPWQLLIAPVPAKLWLLPEAAERTGREFILAYDDAAGLGNLRKRFADGEVSFRTIAMPSTTYKERATRRRLGASEVREIRLSRLPKLVWIVEAIDRAARRAARPSVLAEAVFDSTSSDYDPQVLILRVPGAMLVNQTDGTLRSPIPSTSFAARSAGLSQP